MKWTQSWVISAHIRGLNSRFGERKVWHLSARTGCELQLAMPTSHWVRFGNSGSTITTSTFPSWNYLYFLRNVLISYGTQKGKWTDSCSSRVDQPIDAHRTGQYVVFFLYSCRNRALQPVFHSTMPLRTYKTTDYALLIWRILRTAKLIRIKIELSGKQRVPPCTTASSLSDNRQCPMRSGPCCTLWPCSSDMAVLTAIHH